VGATKRRTRDLAQQSQFRLSSNLASAGVLEQVQPDRRQKHDQFNRAVLGRRTDR
jgi:hypothetical protein